MMIQAGPISSKHSSKANGTVSTSSLEQLYNEMPVNKSYARRRQNNPQLHSVSPPRQAVGRNMVNSSVESSTSENRNGRSIALPSINHSNNSPRRGSPVGAVPSNPYDAKGVNT